MIGLYRPGGSVLHRVPVGAKFVGLAGFSVLLMLPWQQVCLPAAAVAVLTGYAVAGFGPALVARTVRPLIVWVVGIGAMSWWAYDLGAAVVSVATLLLAVLAAGLLTYTSRSQDIMDALIGGLRPFRRLGVNPEQVALAFALALRTVPVLTQVAQTVRQAQVARGTRRHLRAFLTPMVIRTVRHADLLGQALVARGFDDPNPGDVGAER